MDKKYIFNDAIEILMTELVKRGGEVFARYFAQQNEETKKTVESMEFMGRLFSGKLEKDEEEFLKPYLERLWSINTAISVLQKKGFVKEEKA